MRLPRSVGRGIRLSAGEVKGALEEIVLFGAWRYLGEDLAQLCVGRVRQWEPHPSVDLEVEIRPHVKRLTVAEQPRVPQLGQNRDQVLIQDLQAECSGGSLLGALRSGAPRSFGLPARLRLPGSPFVGSRRGKAILVRM